MTQLRRIATVVAVVAGLALSGAASAHADHKDDVFVEEISKLDINFAPDEDLPALGHTVCDTMTAGLAASPNPVPIVRGVIQRLENNGMTKPQAVGVVRASVAVYCPQHARFLGR